jgi:hypothetical protein
MKLIDKLQQGGGMPAFVSYTNVPQPQVAAPYSPATTSKEESDGSVGLLDKNMVKFLYENGIPSDVEAFIETSGIFSDNIYKNPFKKEDATVQYKTILKMLPRIKAESERFKSAMTQADKNGGLGEIAVTDGGHVITVNAEGKLQKKSLNDVDLNSEQILTNSELANYRANSISAAFNTDLTSIINNAIGVPKITEYIQSVINKLGTTSMSREGYVGQQSGKILKGIEYLTALQPSREDLSGMSVDGLYKMSSLDKSQQAQANQALGYLLASLPRNMRTVLQAKAAMYLGDNSGEGVKKLLMSLTQSALSGEHTIKLDLQEKMDAKGNTKSSGSKDNNITDPAKAFLLGLGEIKNHKINNGNSYSLNLPGNSAPMVDTSGKTIGSATLEDAARSTFSGVLDFKNATMGGQLLNSSQRSRVAIDGSNVVAVDLPIDVEALQSGVLKPDIDSLKRLELAENEIREGDIKDEAQKNEIYAKYKLPYKYVNGQINTSAYGRFAILDASADESAFAEDPTMDDTLSEVTDINERESIERILKAADASFKMSQPGLFSSGNNVYSGSVYIPVRQNLINASLGSGHYPTMQGNDAMDIEAKEQQKQKLQTYVPSPSLSTL